MSRSKSSACTLRRISFACLASSRCSAAISSLKRIRSVTIKLRSSPTGFGSDPSIVGKNILLDEKPFTVVGVLPRGFSIFGTSRQFDVWMPMALERAQLHREDHSVIVFGRLRTGVTLAQAQAEMETIKARLKLQYPGVDQQDGIHLVSFRDDLARNLKPGLLILFGAVVLVLLIACVNVANLVLARAATREREITLRAT